MATTYTDTTVSSLVINKMTQAEYDALQNKSETELYLVPDTIDPSNKADKVQSATNGNLAGLDSNGNLSDSGIASSNVATFSSDNGVGIIPEDGIRVETVSSGAAISVNPDVVTLISGAVGTAAITLQVPSDNLAHVWDILMTTDSSVSITIAMSATGSTIKYPADFSISASKSVEISVIGTGTTYYLRYGQFT